MALNGRWGGVARPRIWAPVIAAVMVGGVVGQPGPASAANYVDSTLGEINPADKVTVASPQPVQLLFEFETKGVLNANATQLLKDKVVEAVKSMGVFSEVSEAPTANGAVLQIVINDAPRPGEMAQAEGKGALTGATLFVAGNTVRENYDCTLTYVAGPGAPQITRTANDGVYFQIGLINSPPPNAVRIGSLRDAVFAMSRYIVINPLNALAADPEFQVGRSATPMPPPSPVAQAPAATVVMADGPISTATAAPPPPVTAPPTDTSCDAEKLRYANRIGVPCSALGERFTPPQASAATARIQ